MRAAPVTNGNCQHDEPDMAEFLELLAPGKWQAEHKAVEHLQTADQREREEDQKQRVLDAPVDRTEEARRHRGAVILSEAKDLLSPAKASFRVANGLQQIFSAKRLGELVLQGQRRLDESRLVDWIDDHAFGFELFERLGVALHRQAAVDVLRELAGSRNHLF